MTGEIIQIHPVHFKVQNQNQIYGVKTIKEGLNGREFEVSDQQESLKHPLLYPQ